MLKADTGRGFVILLSHILLNSLRVLWRASTEVKLQPVLRLRLTTFAPAKMIHIFSLLVCVLYIEDL